MTLEEALRAAAVAKDGRAALALGRVAELPQAAVGFEAYLDDEG